MPYEYCHRCHSWNNLFGPAAHPIGIRLNLYLYIYLGRNMTILNILLQFYYIAINCMYLPINVSFSRRNDAVNYILNVYKYLRLRLYIHGRIGNRE